MRCDRPEFIGARDARSTLCVLAKPNILRFTLQSESFVGVAQPNFLICSASMSSSPHVIPHNPADHRYVSIPEVSSHIWFGRCMSTVFPSSISDFVVRDGPNFLKSTSKWTEQHLIAFKCLFLENLPVGRVIPFAYIPEDDDITIQWVKRELSATEEEVRTGKTGFGMAYSFYLQLAAVLQRPPTPPELIVVPQRNLRPASYEKTYHFSSSSDSDYSANSKSSPPRPTKRRTSPSVTFLDPVLEGVGEQTTEDQEMPDPGAQSRTASQQNRSDDTEMEELAKTQSGSEWGRDSGDFSVSSSMKSIDSIEEDKLEALSNQMAVTFLGLLAAMEHHSHEERDRRVSFRSFAVSSYTDMVVSIPSNHN